jgi:hypothetical protein
LTGKEKIVMMTIAFDFGELQKQLKFFETEREVSDATQLHYRRAHKAKQEKGLLGRGDHQVSGARTG